MWCTCNLVLTIVLRNSAKRCRWNREKNPNDYEPMLNIQRQVPACVTDMGWTYLIIYNILYSETIDIYPEIKSFTLISDQIWYFKINQFVWMHLLGIKYVKNKMNCYIIKWIFDSIYSNYAYPSFSSSVWTRCEL